MIAVCVDECGYEQLVDCPAKDKIQIPEEYSFRYWQQFSDRELAENRMFRDTDCDYYNPEEDY